MLEKKYAGGNVPLDGGMASAWLQGGEGGLDREKDDPVCRLFTVRKKPAIKVDENGGNRRVRLPNWMILTPPHLRKIILQTLHNRYGCIYARRYDG